MLLQVGVTRRRGNSLLLVSSYSTTDAPEREPNYKQARDEFKEHAFDMSDTAIALAKSGTVTDKEHADELVRTAKKV